METDTRNTEIKLQYLSLFSSQFHRPVVDMHSMTLKQFMVRKRDNE